MATGRIGTTPVLQVRWSKAPSAGTTSLSGADDNSVTLVYSVGYEAVYRNGVLLSRGNDYTATDGTTVTLIDATIAGDIIEVFANQTVPLSDTYSQSVSNAKFINNTLTTTTGDVIYASAANTPARLGIGSSGQVLTVASGIPSWAAASSGGMTLLSTLTMTGANVTLSNISQSYNFLFIVGEGIYTSSDEQVYIAINNGTNCWITTIRGTTLDHYTDDYFKVTADYPIDNTNSLPFAFAAQIYNYTSTAGYKPLQSVSFCYDGSVQQARSVFGGYRNTSAVTSLVFDAGAANFSGGTIKVYGVK